MIQISIILFFLGLTSFALIFLVIRKLISRRTEKLKFRPEIKLKKELQRQQALVEIDKANAQSEKNDKLFMEERRLKGLRDTSFDLFYDEEKQLHQERLKFKHQSKWKGIIYYTNKKGQIYRISKNGTKIFSNNK
tara:strand:- start:1929 stop:2333 length:405 start_codon:yes stop_codon:yes gene_type:complete